MPEQSLTLARLEELYGAYKTEVARLERERRPGDGIFGLKGGPGDDPCHDRFAETLHGFYEELASLTPDSAAVRELMSFVCCAPAEKDVPRTAYWMLIAVQGLTQPLVGFLNAQDARALAELWESRYRRRERFPAQTALIKALRAAAK